MNLKPPDAHQNSTWGDRQARWRTRVKLSKYLSHKLYLTKMQHHLRHLPQHQGAFYSDYSTWFFDYQACYTVSKTKTRKGKGPKTCLPFCFAWAQAHGKAGLFKHGPSFRRISGTGSSCPQQHDAHLLLNKLGKTRQNTVGETRSENYYGLLKAAFAAVLTAWKQYSSPQIFRIYFADSEPHAII